MKRSLSIRDPFLYKVNNYGPPTTMKKQFVVQFADFFLIYDQWTNYPTVIIKNHRKTITELYT